MLCLNTLRHLLRTENGVTAMEYALLGGLVSVMIILTTSMIGSDLKYTIESLAGAFPTEVKDSDPPATDPADPAGPDDPKKKKDKDPCTQAGENCGKGKV